MYVENYFTLNDNGVDLLNDVPVHFGYNGYGEIVYYRTYSRKKPLDEFEASQSRDYWTGQENWYDTCLRVVNGTMTIRKDHYLKNHIPWDEKFWQKYAVDFGTSMIRMEWLPPGRGLWAMGTDFVYERGSMALNNCGFTNLTSEKLGEDLEWLMDSLMVGCGVGWDAIREPLEIYPPTGRYHYIIGDTREEWAKSVRLLVNAFIIPAARLPIFDYSCIRGKGLPIKGFGGLASGPEPLIKLHKQITKVFGRFYKKEVDVVQLKSDLANMIGCCVVAGNVRRSAEIGLGWIDDPVFRDLKDYKKFPDRAEFGWMSNNTVKCETDEHFALLGEVAKRVPVRGEPGVANLRNFSKGRLNGKKTKHLDTARGANPCITGETKILLADGRGYQRIDSLVDTDPLVYCIDENDDLVVRKMRHVRKTQDRVKILKVIFDDGNFVRVTENHRLMLRDRSFVEARSLQVGDSLAKVNRYTPIDCKGESQGDQYIRVGYGRTINTEGALICQYLYGEIKDNQHIHHIDGDKLNNHPDNLELKDSFFHLSNHSERESNGNFSGYSHQNLIDFGVSLCKKLGRRFSVKEWQEIGPVKAFSVWRQANLGSLLDFASMCADLAEVKNDRLDPRTLRYQIEMEKEGYITDIIDSAVYVQKICEGCHQDFWIKAQQREQACCSLSCNNTIRDYSKNIEGQRKTYAAKKENLKTKQLDVFTALKAKLGRIPLKEEWKEECRISGVSSEISRASSPFRTWSALNYAARNHNHRVVMILEDGFEDVYNGTTDDYHNFVIGGWEEMLPSGRKVERGIVNANCGEIVLQDKELCNLAETCPTNCPDVDTWYRACQFAAFYASTVSLLPTHSAKTNAIVTRNRRIGVGIIDYTGWVDSVGQHMVTSYLRKGYDIVRSTNDLVNAEAGIPAAIKVSCIKPGGSVPKIPGLTSGAGYATFEYTLRRTRIAGNHPMLPLLRGAGIPIEPDVTDPSNTFIFEYPIHQSGRVAEEVSIWEQAMNIVTLQREWADNAVSNTIYFKPKWCLIAHEWEDCWSLLGDNGFKRVESGDNFLHDKKAVVTFDDGSPVDVKIYQYNPNHEEDMIEKVLGCIMPHVKMVSFLPHSPSGVYLQMPEEGISEEEYKERLAVIDKIDWRQFHGSDGDDEKYCQGDKCELPNR